jgi:DHA3 family macrolide efflux protein-like MFS transporter
MSKAVSPLESALETEQVPTPLPAAAPVPPEQLSMGEVLRIPTMRRLWYAQIVSVLGDFLALFAIIDIMTFKLHATPQQVTGLNIAYLLRGGVLLFFVHSIPAFYIVMATISIFSSFFSPAQGVALRAAVPMHGLRSANALMQQVMFIMRVIGAPTAITIVTVFGARACYGLDAASFLASGTLIASLALILPQHTATPPAPTVTVKQGPVGRVFADMQVGASFIFHHAALLFVIVALAAGMFVMGCFGPLIAIYVRDTLHASSTTFAIVSPAIGVGLLIGVNALNAFAKRIANTTQVYLGLGGIAVGTLLLALAPLAALTVLHIQLPIPVTVFGCFLIGFSCAGIIVPSQTLIQQETPPALMGRVGSTTMSAIFSAQIAGLLLSGVLAERTSVRSVFGICTIMLGVLMLAGKLWMEPKPHPAAA